MSEPRFRDAPPPLPWAVADQTATPNIFIVVHQHGCNAAVPRPPDTRVVFNGGLYSWIVYGLGDKLASHPTHTPPPSL